MAELEHLRGPLNLGWGNTTSLVIGGEHVPIPWWEPSIFTYLAVPKLKLKREDFRPRRTRWVRNICVHYTKVLPEHVQPGLGQWRNIGERVASYWSTDGSHAGAHLVVDHDGAVTQHCDLLLHAAYHGGPVNEVSIGIEIYIDAQGRVYDGQIQSACQLIVILCHLFGIQLQCLMPKNSRKLGRIASGARRVVGVYGHRNVTKAKQPHDPGPAVFDKLLHEFGFAPMSCDQKFLNDRRSRENLLWSSLQGHLGLDPDGLPGPATCDALRELGWPNGILLWPKTDDLTVDEGALTPEYLEHPERVLP